MKTFWAALISAAIIASCIPTSSSFAAPARTRTPPATTFNEVPSAPGPPPSLQSDYIIGPQDTLDVNVFQVTDLSKEVKVETSGTILLPLIGQVKAAGRTPKELGEDIAAQFGEKYVKDPLVTVTIKESASQKVTVDGAVMQPGIYPISGNTTLTQAVALARGTVEDANLRQVAIFRNEGARRMAAVVDLSQIRSGKMPDPTVVANDVIVVETSGRQRFLRNLGNIVPFLYLFRGF